jgi:DNA invertase Pin-like site-specific DNA recombinase
MTARTPITRLPWAVEASSLIKARTGEGRVRAKAKSVKFGRPGKLTPYQQREAIERHANGESLASIGKSFNVSHQTVMRLVADAEARQSWRPHCRRRLDGALLQLYDRRAAN